MPIFMVGIFIRWFMPGFERGKGRKTGRFSVAEILKPRGFRKFCEYKILFESWRAHQRRKKRAFGKRLVTLGSFFVSNNFFGDTAKDCFFDPNDYLN